MGVDEVEDDQDLLACDTIGACRVETIEARVNFVDELISGVAMLETALHALLIHGQYKLLELRLG